MESIASLKCCRQKCRLVRLACQRLKSRENGLGFYIVQFHVYLRHLRQ
jgi:hypothetical protein